MPVFTPVPHRLLPGAVQPVTRPCSPVRSVLLLLFLAALGFLGLHVGLRISLSFHLGKPAGVLWLDLVDAVISRGGATEILTVPRPTARERGSSATFCGVRCAGSAPSEKWTCD